MSEPTSVPIWKMALKDFLWYDYSFHGRNEDDLLPANNSYDNKGVLRIGLNILLWELVVGAPITGVMIPFAVMNYKLSGMYVYLIF